jgi:hypothetical protein
VSLVRCEFQLLLSLLLCFHSLELCGPPPLILLVEEIFDHVTKTWNDFNISNQRIKMTRHQTLVPALQLCLHKVFAIFSLLTLSFAQLQLSWKPCHALIEEIMNYLRLVVMLFTYITFVAKNPLILQS